MQSIKAISISSIKHKDILSIIDRIQEGDGLSFSAVVRNLLRIYRDNGYKFPDVGEQVSVDSDIEIDINHPDHPDFVEPDYEHKPGGKSAI
jgi:hypothetical protein